MAGDETLTDGQLDGVRFGRSRALRVLGAAVFGFAGRAAVRPGAAIAYHKVKLPCRPSGGCHCCHGRTCCEPNCTVRNGQCPHTNTTQNSWRVCAGGHQHWCSDWNDKKGRPCICRSTYERACGATPHSCGTGSDADYIAVLTGVTVGKESTVHAAAEPIFFDCGVPVGDVIPQQLTDLVVAAETITDTWDNVVDNLTDPDSLPAGPDVRVLICQKLGLCPNP
jgi:hypothetical protein